jgi:hypothetical protein
VVGGVPLLRVRPPSITVNVVGFDTLAFSIIAVLLSFDDWND